MGAPVLGEMKKKKTCPRSQKCRYVFNPLSDSHNLTKPQTGQRIANGNPWRSHLEKRLGVPHNSEKPTWPDGGWPSWDLLGEWPPFTAHHVPLAVQSALTCINSLNLSISAKEMQATKLIQKDPKHEFRLLIPNSHRSTQKIGRAIKTEACW